MLRNSYYGYEQINNLHIDRVQQSRYCERRQDSGMDYHDFLCGDVLNKGIRLSCSFILAV